jgi:hypothetical protein
MKEVAILLLLVLLLNGCGSNTNSVQAGVGGTWQAQMSGGTGDASNPSFITQFTVNGNTLSISTFQFLTLEPCFPISGGTVSGTVNVVVQTNDTVTGTITITVSSSSNVLTVNGNVTGTAVNNATTLQGAAISGNWSLVGSGTPSGCQTTGGSFTMNQS